jgi:hypothetical protein
MRSIRNPDNATTDEIAHAERHANHSGRAAAPEERESEYEAYDKAECKQHTEERTTPTHRPGRRRSPVPQMRNRALELRSLDQHPLQVKIARTTQEVHTHISS